MSKIPFCDKDALGREKKLSKWVLLRDTCDYPTTSNAYSTMVSEPKLSDDMKGENFRPPLNHFQMDETQGTRHFIGVELSPYMIGDKIFFNFFCVLDTKNTPIN